MYYKVIKSRLWVITFRDTLYFNLNNFVLNFKRVILNFIVDSENKGKIMKAEIRFFKLLYLIILNGNAKLCNIVNLTRGKTTRVDLQKKINLIFHINNSLNFLYSEKLTT